jgi:hypothetical protein
MLFIKDFMKLTNLLPLLAWDTDRHQGVSEKDTRLLNIFKRSVWISVALSVIAEAALSLLYPGSYYSRPDTRSAKILETISSFASRAFLPMSFFSVLQSARVYSIVKEAKKSC